MKRSNLKLMLLVLSVCLATAVGCKKEKPVNAPQNKTVESKVEVNKKAVDTSIDKTSNRADEEGVDIETAIKNSGVEITPEMQELIDKNKAKK